MNPRQWTASPALIAALLLMAGWAQGQETPAKAPEKRALDLVDEQERARSEAREREKHAGDVAKAERRDSTELTTPDRIKMLEAELASVRKSRDIETRDKRPELDATIARLKMEIAALKVGSGDRTRDRGAKAVVDRAERELRTLEERLALLSRPVSTRESPLKAETEVEAAELRTLEREIEEARRRLERSRNALKAEVSRKTETSGKASTAKMREKIPAAGPNRD